MDRVDIKWDEVLEQLLQFVDKGLRLGIEYIPAVEHFIIDKLDAMFAPRQILRQVVMIFVIQVSLMSYNSIYSATQNLLSLLTSKGRKRKQLMDQLSTARTYADWKKLATKLDEMNGNNRWRESDDSTLCDSRMIKKRINSTLEMLERGDVFDLMFRIRGGLARDQFGIQHEGLFTKTLAGPKLLVERYHETVAMALNYICDSSISEEEIPTDAKLAFFNETRHSYGRTALLLSGGAYLGYYHMGVVKALFREGLMPRVISGASAGSIITAVIGTRTEQELSDLIDTTEGHTAVDRLRTDFFRYSEELKSEIARKLNYLVPQGMRFITFPIFSSIFDKKILNLDTEHFKKALMQDVGLYTFQEAFDRTGRIINITVAPLNHYDPPRLLNYLTAPHVCVWSAAAASCALPGIFDSVSLIVKEPNGQFRPENEWTRQALVDKEEVKAAKLASYSDGSLENDLPMQQLSELFNVNHFIVSQVNPHSAILSSLAMKATVWSNPIYGAIVGYLRFLTAQCRDWLKNIVDFFIFRSKSPVWSARRGLTQTLTQDYEGRETDVTIMPWAGHISAFTALISAIKNPTDEEFDAVVVAAERNTFPSIPRIRAHCLIEMTLDKCVQRLRKRLTDEVARAKAQELLQEQRQQQLESNGNLGSSNSGSFSAHRKMDRTPSFYTSRSIVNLSGLSVADPLPLPSSIAPHHSQNLSHSHSSSQAGHHSVHFHDPNNTSSSGIATGSTSTAANTASNARASSLQGIFDSASSPPVPSSATVNNNSINGNATSNSLSQKEVEVLQPVPNLRPVYGRRQSSNNSAQRGGIISQPTPPPMLFGSRSRSNSVSVNQAGYYDTVDVDGGDGIFMDRFGSPGPITDNNGNGDFWRLNVNYGSVPLEKAHGDSRHNSRDSLQDHSSKKEDITKTTRMADFYYRKGMSSDKLSELK